MFAEIFDKRKTLKFLFTLCLFFLMYYIYFHDLKSFLFITDSLEALMGFIIAIIAINTYNISRNKIFTFLAISLGFFSITEVASVLFNYYNYLDTLLSEHMYIQIFGSYLKIFSIILSYKFYDKYINFKLINLLYFIAVLSFLLLLFVFNVFPSIYTTVFFNFTIKDVLNFLLYMISLYSLYMFYKNDDNLNLSDMRILMYIAFFFNFAITLFCLHRTGKPSSIFRFAANISLLVHLYFMCKVIIQAVLVKPYNMLFYDLDKKSKELEKSKDLYKGLVDSIPASVLIRKDNKIVFSNITSLNLFKCNKKDDLKGKDITSMIPNDHIVDFMKNSRSHKDSFETKFNTLDEDTFDAMVSEINVTFEDSQCVLALIRDISERKKIDELNMKLQKKIEEDNLRTEFFSNLSHELKTPINVIYSILQLEDIYIKNRDIDSIEKHNHVLKQNCFRLLRICNNLIDVTRIDGGFFRPNMKCKNIVYTIESIVDSVVFYIGSKNMEIIFDTESEEIYTLYDEDLIERIILNLISNSLKYGNQGGNIWVTIYDELENIKIVFRDDGPGIAKDECENIFERFVQVDRSFTRKCEGSGLGLSLVKSLIELHNGSITLNSGEGLGCEFIIQLPKYSDLNIDEVAVSNDKVLENNGLVDKVQIEFSDIYL